MAEFASAFCHCLFSVLSFLTYVLGLVLFVCFVFKIHLACYDGKRWRYSQSREEFGHTHTHHLHFFTSQTLNPPGLFSTHPEMENSPPWLHFLLHFRRELLCLKHFSLFEIVQSLPYSSFRVVLSLPGKTEPSCSLCPPDPALPSDWRLKRISRFLL